MNTFENFYNRIRDAKAAFEAAGSEDEKNTARAAYKAVWDELKVLGNAACRLFREYETSRDSGNECLDISEVVWDKEVESLVAAMRENGIGHFTFSSGWSSAVETAWLFQQSGCTLEGLIEINSKNTKWDSDEHEKAHGYLFRVQA